MRTDVGLAPGPQLWGLAPQHPPRGRGTQHLTPPFPQWSLGWGPGGPGLPRHPESLAHLGCGTHADWGSGGRGRCAPSCVQCGPCHARPSAPCSSRWWWWGVRCRGEGSRAIFSGQNPSMAAALGEEHGAAPLTPSHPLSHQRLWCRGRVGTPAARRCPSTCTCCGGFVLFLRGQEALRHRAWLGQRGSV